MGLLPPVMVEIQATTTEFMARMGEARAELDKMQSKGESSLGAFSQFGTQAFMAVGAAAVALGVESLHLADAFEVSHARLEASLVANGTSFDAWSKQIGAADSAGEKLGFTNQQVEDGLARLEVMVKNPTVAIKDLAVAEDVARARGMDLTTASNLVGKASEGTYTALVRLGVVTAAQAKSFSSGAQAVEYLGRAFGGQAMAYATTFSGKMEVLKAQAEDIGKNIGLWLIPKIEAVGSAISGTFTFFEQNHAALVALGTVISAVVVPALAKMAVGLAVTVVEGMAAAVEATVGFIGTLSEMAIAVMAADIPLVAITSTMAAAVAPIAAVIGVLELMKNSEDNAAQASNALGQALADAFVKQAGDGADKIAALHDKVVAIGQALISYSTQQDLAKQSGLSLAQVNQALRVEGESLGKTLVATRIAQVAATQAGVTDTITKAALTQATKDATTAVKDATTASKDYFDAAVAADRADISWADKTDQLTAALKKSHDSISLTNADGRAARTIVDDLVAATDTQITAELASGDTADQMRVKIAAYVKTLDDTARSAGMTAAQVADMNARFHLTEGTYTATIVTNVAAAEAELSALRQQALQAVGLPSNFIGPVFPPGKAAGGDVAAGMPYIVGEKGRELFIPDVSGSIIANDRVQAALIASAGSADVAEVAKQMAAGMQAAMNASTAAMGLGVTYAAGLPGGGAPGANAALGQQMAAARGWTGAEWIALNNVAMAESGWNQFARNASSGAYGIAQALPESKYPFAGTRAGGSNPGAQIGWMDDYIKGRYGDPIAAWAHEQSAHWYGNGGIVPGPLGSPQMAVVHGGETITPAGGGGTTINITVNVGTLVGPGGEAELARRLRLELLRQGRGLVNIGLA